jgi:hypothetical protein
MQNQFSGNVKVLPCTVVDVESYQKNDYALSKYQMESQAPPTNVHTVIYGGTHNHIYGSTTLEKEVEDLRKQVQSLMLLLTPATPTPKIKITIKRKAEPEPAVDSEPEEDEPVTEQVEQQALLEELNIISQCRIDLATQGANTEAFSRLNQRKAKVDARLYGQLNYPIEIFDDLVDESSDECHI